ncbi:MAG TPA: hypothetical protein VEA41_00200 [Salinarimonas sp.]|nr:hypothetical protein [Salinarimonas sp.]
MTTRPARSLTPLRTVLARLRDGLAPVAPARIAPQAAIGAVLAEPLAAPAPVPARALARRAGVAVAASDTVGASPYAPVVPALAPVPVEAGAPLPPGADAVLEPGDLVEDGPYPEILAALAPGDGARRAGEDVPAGTILRGAGERVRPLDAALARALGHDALAVRRPRVLVWSRDAGAAAALLSGALAGLAEVTASPAPRPADLVIGVGEDVAAEGIARLADRASLIAHGIAMAPGGEAAAGLSGCAPWILLPGRLEEAFAGLHLLVRPLLDHLARAAGPVPVAAPLSAKLVSSVGIAEMALLRREAEGWRPLAVGDLAWSKIAEAEAWTLVAPESEGFAPGETVAAVPLDGGGA